MIWERMTLSEVAIINPRRPRLERPDDAITSFVPMEAVDEVAGAVRIYAEKPFALVKKGYTYFENGDVIFAKITPCMQNGKHAIVDKMIDGFGFGSTEFHVIRSSEKILPEWIYFYLRRQETLDAAKRTFTGAVGQQRVPPNFLEELELPVPPREIQARTLVSIKNQLAELQRARDAASLLLSEIKFLPQRILKHAFEN